VRVPLAVAIMVLAAPRSAAEPGPRERAAVVAIDLGPSAPVYLRVKAAGRIEAGLAAAGYDVVPAARVRARLTGELARCRDGACMRRVGEALGAHALVLVTIDGVDDNTVVSLRLHDGRTGAREAEVREVCDLCGEAELAGRLRTAARSLRARSLEARQRELERRAPIAASTRPAAPPAAPPPARAAKASSMLPGLLLAAAGALAVGGGMYLVSLDGRGTCSPGDGPIYPAPGAVIRYPDPSDPSNYVCRDLYETRTLGFVSAAAGATAIAAGVALVVRARQRGPVLEVTPRPGGATMGVSWVW
jgi:hypothetical protein